MYLEKEKILLAMILMRVLSSGVELISAVLMYYFQRVDIALRINAILGLFGPIILLTVTLLGISGLKNELNPLKISLILGGVFLIFLGSR